MKLVVQTLDQKTTDVEVDDSATVMDLKKQIEKAKTHPADQIKLIFSGAVLSEDNKKLSDCKIIEGSKVVLLLQKPKPVVTQPVQTNIPPAPNATAPSATATPSVSVPNVPTTEAPTTAGTPAMPNLFNMFNAGAAAAGANPLAAGLPQALMQMLMTNPQIQQLIQQNPQALMQVLGNMQGGMGDVENDENYDKIFEGDIELTEEQKKEVQEIVGMGCGSFENVIQYYVAFGYNKEQTINALLNEELDDNEG